MLEIITNCVGITLTVLYGVLFSGEFRTMGAAKTSSISMWTWMVVAVHLLALIFRGIQIGACPVDSHWETLSLLALLIVTMHLLLARVSGDRCTLIFGLGLTFVMQLAGASLSLGDQIESQPPIGSVSSLHAFTAWIGVAGVTTAGVHGVLWLLLKRSIKTGQFGLLFTRLSSLESLSRLIRIATSIAAGSLAITVGTSIFLGNGVEASTGPVTPISLTLMGLFVILALVPRSSGTVTEWRAWCSVVGLASVIFISAWVIQFGPHSR